MKYYLLKIDTIINTFSILDSGKRVSFEYTSAIDQGMMADIQVGDMIIGYNDSDRIAKMVFKVERADSPQRIVLFKEIDISTGGKINEELLELMSDKNICNISEEQYKSLYSEMVKCLLNSETEDKKYLIVDEDAEDYSVEKLGEILLSMYDGPDVASKTTAIHMFGVKYGKIIKEKGYSAASIIAAAGVSETYQVELGKGLRMYESIRKDEFGVKFYEDEDIKCEYKLKNCLEIERSPRSDKSHPLNMIIYGAPGTGKTYGTAEYALKVVGLPVPENRKELMRVYNELLRDGQVVFTTFHQSYGYEEFIQGLRPDTNSDKMAFKTVDGVFKKIADRALNDLENNYVIIIDEINRANISKVFGELITLIEEDKRWGEVNETCATLQSGDVFAVPNNLYIIGTMNSADKSISLIDAALRRRFIFKEQRPNSSLINDEKLRKLFERLNAYLYDSLGSGDLLVGHSYFMNKTADELPDIMNNSIIPLLYEYFYDNKKNVCKALDDTIEKVDYTVIDDKTGRVYIVEKEL